MGNGSRGRQIKTRLYNTKEGLQARNMDSGDAIDLTRDRTAWRNRTNSSSVCLMEEKEEGRIISASFLTLSQLMCNDK